MSNDSRVHTFCYANERDQLNIGIYLPSYSEIGRRFIRQIAKLSED